MTASNFDLARENMVEHQVRPWDVLDQRVLDTLSAIPRDAFVPAAYKSLAYADTAIPLNETETMMHPVVEGRLLQALDIQPRDEILEIGTGSGYLTACLAYLGSHVDSYEIDAELAEQAQNHLRGAHIYNVEIRIEDAVSHFSTKKTYDAIAVTGSMGEIPEQYKQALAVGGRLFVIIGEAPIMTAHKITRIDGETWTDEVLFETLITPLKHAEKPAVFEF